MEQNMDKKDRKPVLRPRFNTPVDFYIKFKTPANGVASKGNESWTWHLWTIQIDGEKDENEFVFFAPEKCNEKMLDLVKDIKEEDLSKVKFQIEKQEILQEGKQTYSKHKVEIIEDGRQQASQSQQKEDLSETETSLIKAAKKNEINSLEIFQKGAKESFNIGSDRAKYLFELHMKKD